MQQTFDTSKLIRTFEDLCDYQFLKNILFSTNSSNSIATRISRSSSSSGDVKRYS